MSCTAPALGWAFLVNVPVLEIAFGNRQTRCSSRFENYCPSRNNPGTISIFSEILAKRGINLNLDLDLKILISPHLKSKSVVGVLYA